VFFGTSNVEAKILTVIQMGWQRVNARAGFRPFHTLSYRLVGDARFFSEERELMEVREGEIVFIPAGFDFTKQAGEGRIVAVHFVSDSELPTEMLRFSPENSSHFRSEFQKLHEIWSRRNPGYEYEAKILLYRILLRMEQEWSRDRQADSGNRLSAALEYIHSHFSEGDVSVADLAALCGMSDTYFRKLFVAQFGMNPQSYISRLRLTTATELLQSGYYTVGEIADRCGFHNINYFSAFIKKETGLPPLRYRNMLLRNRNP
jgi:AraC-like DNA-binding protein